MFIKGFYIYGHRWAEGDALKACSCFHSLGSSWRESTAIYEIILGKLRLKRKVLPEATKPVGQTQDKQCLTIKPEFLPLSHTSVKKKEKSKGTQEKKC